MNEPTKPGEKSEKSAREDALNVSELAADVVLSRKYWCIQRDDKWCALMNGNEPENPPELEQTLCDHKHLTELPTRYREPDCSNCRTILHHMVSDQVR